MKGIYFFFATLILVCVTHFAFGESYTVNQTDVGQRIFYSVEFPQGWKIIPMQGYDLTLTEGTSDFGISVGHTVSKQLPFDKIANFYIKELNRTFDLNGFRQKNAPEKKDVYIGKGKWTKIKFDLVYKEIEDVQVIMYLSFHKKVIYQIAGATQHFSEDQNRTLKNVVKSFTLFN